MRNQSDGGDDDEPGEKGAVELRDLLGPICESPVGVAEPASRKRSKRARSGLSASCSCQQLAGLRAVAFARRRNKPEQIT